MRRKRVLVILTILFGMAMPILWLGNVLADATVQINQPLVVDEGGSGIINNSLLLSNDPDAPGAILTYTLVTTPANGTLVLTNLAASLTPTAKFTQSDIDSGFLQYTHNGTETASDGFNFTVETSTTLASNSFLINVTPVFDEAPVVSNQTFFVAENSTTGTAVNTIVASDLDFGDSLTYTIVGGNTGNPFAVGSSNGAVTVNSPTPLNFETNPSLTFTVQVEDLGNLTDTAVITVNVTNENEKPTVNDTTFSLAENSSIGSPVGTVTATDPDAGETITYTIVGGNTGNAFAVGSSNGAITVNSATPLNFEVNPSITFTLQAEDSGNLTDTAVITVNLTNQNEPPNLNNTTFSVAENTPNSTLVGIISATDPDAGDAITYTITASNPVPAFAIGSTNGRITVSNVSQLDFETRPTFTLTVEAKDRGLLTDTAQVIINLTNANDAPVLSAAGPFFIPENSPNTTAVGTPIVATDQDLSAGDILTYSITAGNTGGAFSIGSNGQIAVANSTLLDYDTPPTSYNLTVQVRDTAGLTDSEVVIVNLTNVNEPPTTNTATYEPNENLGNGELVGDVLATDPEGATLNYQITAGNSNNAFAVNSAGEIIVNNSSQLDYETTPSFVLTVAVDDGVNPSVNATVNINLQDLNENPTVNNATFSVNENSSNGTAVGTVTFSDPDAADAGNLIFDILSGNAGDAFAIGNNGQITVANTNQLDYETRTSFTLGIIVTDTGSLNNTANITININNLYDENPTVSNASFFVQQGAADGVLVGTVSATDPELVSGDQLTYSIIGGNTGTVFAIGSSNGRITVPDASKLDANTMPTFNLTVRVMDRGGQTDTATITINVTPLPITYIYLPVMLNDFPRVEPNNNCSQAFDLTPGVTYEFTADDQEDWYAITLSSARNVSISLSSFEPANGQLIIYGGTCGSSLNLLQSNGTSSSTKTINISLGAGKYYIRVYSVPITNTTYNLRVNFN